MRSKVFRSVVTLLLAGMASAGLWQGFYTLVVVRLSHFDDDLIIFMHTKGTLSHLMVLITLK